MLFSFLSVCLLFASCSLSTAVDVFIAFLVRSSIYLQHLTTAHGLGLTNRRGFYLSCEVSGITGWKCKLMLSSGRSLYACITWRLGTTQYLFSLNALLLHSVFLVVFLLQKSFSSLQFGILLISLFFYSCPHILPLYCASKGENFQCSC